MPFSRPTRAEIFEQLIADIETDLPDADARLPYSDLNVTARALSTALHGLYGYESWAAKQIHPDSADEDILVRHAAWWGILQKAASSAAGTATLPGTPGRTLPALTPVIWNSLSYTTDEEVTIPVAGSVAVALTAVEPGAAGNVTAGSKLRLASPVDGIVSEMVTAAGLSGGADKEEPAALLSRLLARMQTPPHGGSSADYKAWALEVAGVTRAWVRTVEDEPGHIRVLIYMVMDGRDDIIPTAAEVAAAQAHIDSVRPVTAEALAVAPAPAPLNPIIRISPATDAVRAAVQAELADMLAREAAPGDAEGGAGTILLSHLRATVSAAAGEYDNAVLDPVADVVPANGAIVTLGEITWA